MSPEPSLPDATQVGRVRLTVADLAEPLAFYRDVVGLAVQGRTDGAATLGAGDSVLLELAVDAERPERGPRETGLFHTAFRVPDRAALGDALARIRADWHLDGASDHLVSEALYLSDPADNGVEIYCDRPRDAWPTTPDGGVEMDTLPLDLQALPTTAGPADRVPEGTDVGHVHLEVSDLAATRSFYVDALGLSVRQAWGESALFLAAGGYHHHVGANVWNRRTGRASGRGLDRFDVVVPDEEVVAAVRRRLANAGHEVSTTEGGVLVADPDGVTVRVLAGEHRTG